MRQVRDQTEGGATPEDGWTGKGPNRVPAIRLAGRNANVSMRAGIAPYGVVLRGKAQVGGEQRQQERQANAMRFPVGPPKASHVRGASNTPTLKVDRTTGCRERVESRATAHQQDIVDSKPC